MVLVKLITASYIPSDAFMENLYLMFHLVFDESRPVLLLLLHNLYVHFYVHRNMSYHTCMLYIINKIP